MVGALILNLFLISKLFLDYLLQLREIAEVQVMEVVFLLEDGERSLFLQRIVQSFRCSYICLWSYMPHPSNSCLICMDGFYIQDQGENNSGYAAFHEYRNSMFLIDRENHQHVPGLAFKNDLPYLELKEFDLQRLVSTKMQLHFYQVARIKTVMFMGCRRGEIELGMPNLPHVNLEMEMKNWFPSDFLRRTTLTPPSSSSSSLRSLSMDSPECSNRPSGEEPQKLNAAQIPQLARSINRPFQFPGTEKEHAAMTEAILAVLSCPSSSSSSSASLALTNQLPAATHHQIIISSSSRARPSAFKRYTPSLSNYNSSTSGRQQDMLKRSINFFRTLNQAWIQEQMHGGRAPTCSQLQHMISERRRREKLNQSFQTIKSLLPPSSKKDKASILSSTIEHIVSLKSQLSELTRKNQDLMAKLFDKPRDKITRFSNEPLDVRLSHVATSTSRTRVFDLHVVSRGINVSLMDAVIRLLEFLKQVRNVNLISLNTSESDQINNITLRLNINDEDGEWDGGSFQEAVKRLVSDLAQ